MAVALAAAVTAGEPAWAAATPSAVTGPPSAVALTSATLTGSVAPNGIDANWLFELGTSTGYGRTTPVASVGSRGGSVAVATNVTGLTPGVTYDYRLVVRSDAGTVNGANVSFRTAAAPPTVTSSAIAAVHDSSAVLSATIDPNGLSSTWYVRYGTSAGFGEATAVHGLGSGLAPVTVSVGLGALTPHTGYVVQVVATNAAGSREGGEHTLTTTGPPIVTTGAASDVAPTSAKLTGSVVPDGHATTWYFQYGPTAAYGASSPVADAGASVHAIGVTRTISGLAANTTYHYRLVATSVDGTVVGADATFTTPGPTIAASSGALTFGGWTALSGEVPSGAANQPVVVYAQPAGAPSFAAISTVLTGASGAWSLDVQPQLATAYKVIWRGEVSATVTVAVSPSVTLRERAPGRFVAHVAGAISFSGRIVRLQRLAHGTWRTVAARPLNGDSSVTFRPRLPAGRFELRVYLTAYQAGSDYLAAVSGVHRYRVG